MCALLAGLMVLSLFAPSPASTHADPPPIDDPTRQRIEKLVQREGTDPTFAELMKQKAFPVGKNSDTGVKGSRLRVNTGALQRAAGRDDPIPKNIKLHTICNSHIPRDKFARWTRWYQEAGNTQVFRMFKGEHNVRNDRPGAGRVEAYSDLAWKEGDGWHDWIGTYTIIQPHGCMIFQVKNRHDDWAVSIAMNDAGDIKVNHRRHQDDQVIARGMIAKPFTIGIRDNGHDYQVYLNNEKVGEGQFKRPKGETRFRWGMYDGTFRHDALLLVTGVRFE